MIQVHKAGQVLLRNSQIAFRRPSGSCSAILKTTAGLLGLSNRTWDQATAPTQVLPYLRNLDSLTTCVDPKWCGVSSDLGLWEPCQLFFLLPLTETTWKRSASWWTTRDNRLPTPPKGQLTGRPCEWSCGVSCQLHGEARTRPVQTSRNSPADPRPIVN